MSYYNNRAPYNLCLLSVGYVNNYYCLNNTQRHVDVWLSSNQNL